MAESVPGSFLITMHGSSHSALSVTLGGQNLNGGNRVLSPKHTVSKYQSLLFSQCSRATKEDGGALVPC